LLVVRAAERRRGGIALFRGLGEGVVLLLPDALLHKDPLHFVSPENGDQENGEQQAEQHAHADVEGCVMMMTVDVTVN
jgi:hypothetical protein